MKMELRQLVALLADHEDVSGLPGIVVVHPNRSAVVDQVLERRAPVLELKGRQRGAFRAADVDGRLFPPSVTGPIVGIQLAPVFGAARSLIAPRRSPLGAPNDRQR